MVGQYELQIFHFQKAAKILDSLYLLRKEKYPEYQVLLAPFYYRVGDALATYVELNTNEMGALKPLELPDDPDEEEPAAASEEAKDEDEPVIADVPADNQINSSSAAAPPEAPAQNPIGGEEGQKELEELSEDIFENFGLAHQII